MCRQRICRQAGRGRLEPEPARKSGPSKTVFPLNLSLHKLYFCHNRTIVRQRLIISSRQYKSVERSIGAKMEPKQKVGVAVNFSPPRSYAGFVGYPISVVAQTVTAVTWSPYVILCIVRLRTSLLFFSISNPISKLNC